MLTVKSGEPDVNYSLGTTPIQPIVPRKYTLFPAAHGSSFSMSIGVEFAYDKISKYRNEILAEFKFDRYSYIFCVYCYIGDCSSQVNAIERNLQFVQQLPAALKAVRHGDSAFFHKNPALEHCPVFVHFDSNYPQFSRVETWKPLLAYK